MSVECDKLNCVSDVNFESVGNLFEVQCVLFKEMSALSVLVTGQGRITVVKPRSLGYEAPSQDQLAPSQVHQITVFWFLTRYSNNTFNSYGAFQNT